MKTDVAYQCNFVVGTAGGFAQPFSFYLVSEVVLVNRTKLCWKSWHCASVA